MTSLLIGAGVLVGAGAAIYAYLIVAMVLAERPVLLIPVVGVLVVCVCWMIGEGISTSGARDPNIPPFVWIPAAVTVLLLIGAIMMTDD